MKKFVKIMASCFALTLCVLFGANTADAESFANKSTADYDYDTVDDLKQTAATANTVTLSWTPTAGATQYRVFASVNSTYVPLSGILTTNYATVKLPAYSKYNVFVVCNLVDNGSYKYGDSIEAKTLPGKTTIGYSSVYCYANSIYYGWKKVGSADGYQVEYKGSGQSKKYKKVSSYSTSADCGKFINRFQQARVRSYNVINGRTYYSGWSNYIYTAVPSPSKVSARYYRSSRKIVIKWPKVTGAYHYKVYISKKDKKHYKKAATLSSKKRSYTIRKYGKAKLKKGTKYYVKLVVTGKVSGKEKASSYFLAYYQTI